MVLVVDIGNSRTKAAVFEHNSVVFQTVFLYQEIAENFKNIFKNFPKIEHLVISSVKNEEEMLFKMPNHVMKHVIDRSFDFPFENKYATPHTLGIDRMVLASGAVLMFPDTNRLVIDAGTCITYDWINNQNEYLGGGISPGLQLRYKSLHSFTDKLPLLSPQFPSKPIGNSTAESIHVGVVMGVIAEIEHHIRLIESSVENFTIILTGGDTDFLAKRLKNTIFANSNFLIESLYHTFQYKIHNG